MRQRAGPVPPLERKGDTTKHNTNRCFRIGASGKFPRHMHYPYGGGSQKKRAIELNWRDTGLAELASHFWMEVLRRQLLAARRRTPPVAADPPLCETRRAANDAAFGLYLNPPIGESRPPAPR